MHHFAAFPASYLVCALQITQLYRKKDGHCLVELRSGDLKLIRIIAKLKELKTEITHAIDYDDVRRNRKMKSGLILVSGLLNDAVEELSKMAPARGD
jgi:hypothetical protein